METAVYSPRDAKVSDVLVKPGSMVSREGSADCVGGMSGGAANVSN